MFKQEYNRNISDRKYLFRHRNNLLEGLVLILFRKLRGGQALSVTNESG